MTAHIHFFDGLQNNVCSDLPFLEGGGGSSKLAIPPPDMAVVDEVAALSRAAAILFIFVLVSASLAYPQKHPLV